MNDLDSLREAMRPRPGPPITLRALLPTATVALLAILGPTLHREDRCASTDGPQFACWLEEQ